MDKVKTIKSHECWFKAALFGCGKSLDYTAVKKSKMKQLEALVNELAEGYR